MGADDPSWLEIQRDENRAFIALRATDSSVVDWGLLTSAAQYVLGNATHNDVGTHDRLLDFEQAHDLIAASRILDNAAQAAEIRGYVQTQLKDTSLGETEIEDADNSDKDNEHEAFSLALLSAVAYAMHGNFCSATAVFNRNPPDPKQLSAAQNAIVAICAPHLTGQSLEGVRHRIQIEQQQTTLARSSQWPSPLNLNAENIFTPRQAWDSRKSLSQTVVSSAANIYKFLESFEFMLRQGDEGANESLTESFKKCIGSDWSSLELALWGSCRIAVSHAIKLSVARNIKYYGPQISSEFIDNLNRLARRVFFPPQLRALQKGLLKSNEQNCLISLPTSAGKTLLSEIALVNALRTKEETADDSGSLGCYVVPYIALGNQVADVLKGHLFGTGIRVHKIFGDYPWPDAEINEPSRAIIVATPERLDSVLRTKPELLDRIRCVVCDEAHMIERSVRGIRLEGLLTRFRLKQIQQKSHNGKPPRNTERIRIIAVSAVVSQADPMLEWLNNGTGTLHITDQWRPTAKRFAVWKEDGKLTWHIGQETVGSRGLPPDTVLGSLRLPWPETGFGFARYANAARPQYAKAYVNISYLVDYLRTAFYGQPILCVCATKESSRTLAQEIIKRIPQLEVLGEQIARAIQIIEAQHHFLRPLAKCLRHGVAFHNASIPYEIRDLIESGVRNREILVVTSTTTLAEGVDLPFRLTVLVDWIYYQDGNASPMSTALFRNIIGRCGRAGIFTEGDTIVFDNPIGDYNVANPYSRARAQKEIFFSGREKPLQSAINKAVTESANGELKACLESQFLAAVNENPHIDDIEKSFAEHSFAAKTAFAGGTNSKDVLEGELRKVSDFLLTDFKDQGAFASRNSPLLLTELGKAVNSTAFSPPSCRRIITWLSTMDAVDEFNSSFFAGILSRFSDLPEQTIEKVKTIVREPNPRKGLDIA